MMGLVAKLSKLEPLFEALSLFGMISKNVELRFEPTALFIIAYHDSPPRFIATLHISSSFFSNYIVEEIHAFQVLLSSFHDALLLNAQVSSTLNVLFVKDSPIIALRFHEPSDINVPPMIHLLRFVRPKAEVLGGVDGRNYFSILSSELRRIIKQLPLFRHHFVCVTVTSSQVKFSVGSEEIVVTKESGICQIEGFEVETELQVVFVPMLFFIDLTYKSNLIWFYKELNSNCLIVVPLDDEDGEAKQRQYVIHFPKM